MQALKPDDFEVCRKILIAGSRNAQRAFFPANMLLVAFETKDTIAEEQTLPLVDITNCDFSGKGMWLIYKACMMKEWGLETAMDDVPASQIVYHSIFGTQNEDLGVLQSITSVRSPWRLRSEIAGAFRSQKKVFKKFTLPKQIYFCKLSQAIMTGILTESAFQISSKQVFAGKRTKVYLESFHKHMKQNNPNSMSSGLTLPALADFYRRLKNDLLKKIEDGAIHGTVDWRSVETLTATHAGTVSAITVRESGRYFCGRSDI